MMHNSERELDSVLRKFAGFIRLHLHKFCPGRFGLDPEDLYQEIRIKIWKVIQSEKEINNLASYLKKIINSTVIDQIRKTKREDNIYSYEVERKSSELKSHCSNAANRNTDLAEVVGIAVDKLIESRRLVVKLYLMNMSIEEIASFCMWSRDKTRNLLYRGLSDLRKHLRKYSGADGYHN